ncbi:AMIN domain-containing protein [Sorangium sp. So ce1000]|uniref:AMIN domain-containing protein n=1 Tax=Sorangium sp. So ce1000 TaxID=3133325 RepID=UPI003F5E4002
MRPPRHLSLSLSLALGLASPLALAQGAPAAQPAPKAAAAPAKAAAPQKPAVSQPRGGSAGAPPAARQRHARARKSKKKEAQPSLAGRPVATFPGFRMLPTGGSRVFVQIQGGKVDVAESKAAGRLVYRLKGAGAIQTNRFPIVTSFFATPVTQVQLVDQGNDLDMVIDLRTQTDATYRVIETDQGMVLQVDFPPSVPEQRSAAPAEVTRKRSDRRTISQEPGSDAESSDL